MRSFEFPIEAGHIQEFKRAVGDLDASFDPDAAAPPTFMVAADRYDPDYDRRLALRSLVATGGTRVGIGVPRRNGV